MAPRIPAVQVTVDSLTGQAFLRAKVREARDQGYRITLDVGRRGIVLWQRAGGRSHLSAAARVLLVNEAAVHDLLVREQELRAARDQEGAATTAGGGAQDSPSVPARAPSIRRLTVAEQDAAYAAGNPLALSLNRQRALMGIPPLPGPGEEPPLRARPMPWQFVACCVCALAGATVLLVAYLLGWRPGGG